MIRVQRRVGDLVGEETLKSGKRERLLKSVQCSDGELSNPIKVVTVVIGTSQPQLNSIGVRGRRPGYDRICPGENDI